jgi:hypothetical protein
MAPSIFKSFLIKAALAVPVLLLAGGVAQAQQQVNLAAGPATAALPDGSLVPMWGYSCGPVVSGSSATCAALNPNAGAGWSPVVITVPTGQVLQINLTNNLSFPVGSATPTVTIPTSLTIVGQIGGGLGTTATSTPSPDHSGTQANVTWPIAGPAGTPGTPPTQGQRVQSFSTEVAASTVAPTPTQVASGSALTWSNLRPGTYLLESGTHPSIQGPMGLYGILVVTSAPNTTTSTAGIAYGAGSTAVSYSSEVPLAFSEIDPVQNNAVNTAVNTPGFSETTVWSGLPGGCGNAVNSNGSPNTGATASATPYGTCYPPAVNYTPTYYLINGVAFDKANPTNSVFRATAGTAGVVGGPPVTTGITGNVLVRMVNAGLRMHVPSIVGSVTGAGGAAGLSLIAEDGNPLPGVARVQSEVFMAAGKTYDVMVNVPAATQTALPVFDRELSLSGNATARDAGMLAYLGVNGSTVPATGVFATAGAQANPDTYFLVAGNTLVVSDPARGVIANDVNVNGVQLLGPPAAGKVTLSTNGTFTYIPNTGTTSDSFTYCANGSVTAATCSSGITATVTLASCASTAGCMESGNGISMGNATFTSPNGPKTTAPPNPAHLFVNPPGVLAYDKDGAGHPLTVDTTTVSAVTPAGASVAMNPDGSFTATATAAGSYTFTYKAKNSQGTQSTGSATVTLIFPAAAGPVVSVLDGKDVLNHVAAPTRITDYRWVIEEDRTFYVDPSCTTNPPAAGCPGSALPNSAGGNGIVLNFGTNFHTSHMPVVATGCTGTLSCESGQTMVDTDPNSATYLQHINVVCDVGNGVCRPGAQQTPVDPSQVALDPTKRYYISVLPGDAANPFINVNLSADCANGAAAASNPGQCGHGMGGAPIAAGQTTVTILTQPSPYPPSKLSVFVFEDDFPLNGEQDGGGGVDVLSPNEPGLGGFNITLFDDAGGTGDATGQMTYDMFNQPLSNSLSGSIDPATGLDACPISKIARIGPQLDANGNPIAGTYDPTQTGLTGTIVTCPKYEADGRTLSPLAGQAVIANLMPGRFGVVATPGADRIGRGEEWLQTNTLDGQKAHDSFLRIGEPSFFQEFGPAGFHVSIGFANPAIINARKPFVCNATDPNIQGTNCTNTLTGHVSTERMSRTPDERLYGSGDYTSFSFTQCYVSFGDVDGEDFAFTKCDANGNFTLSGLPDGDWRVTVFDQWNDMLVDGLSTPVRLAGGTTKDLGELATNQWQTNIYTRTFLDTTGTGLSTDDGGTTVKPGLTLVPTNNRYRDGSFSNFNNTDLSGNAGFNEIFPLFNWYVIETDSTRFKNTGTHVVYDSGGPADGSPECNPTGAGGVPPTAPCSTTSTNIAGQMANTVEQVSVPTNLRVPGAVYCASADCVGRSIANPASSDPPSACTTSPTTGLTTCTTTLSTGRIDPPWVKTEAWQGFSGENEFIEFGKAPFKVGENGGIHGHVVYASTRPFDDPQLLIQNQWEPLVPGVSVNLYQVGTAADGTQSLTLVDTTKTSSWDDWAQGFRSDGIPNMNCPGQLPSPTSSSTGDLFFFSLYDQPNYLDYYNAQHPAPGNYVANPVTGFTPLPNASQFKCYDGMHNWNQVQPAPYDGMYEFPSIAGRDPTTGKPVGGTNPSVPGTNCSSCVVNPFDGNPMLPAGKYVVEVVVPPGYELVKEEDKNILIGDNFIAPVTVQFPGLAGSVYILPDQAAIGATYNANNAQNSTVRLGTTAVGGIDATHTQEEAWPCVGESRIVPDFISLYPGSAEVSPFAGARRNLCDRKLVSLDDQTSALAKFWIFTSTHVASHFAGVITDDFTSEFDPYSPQFGEKFSPADLPVAIKDWTGQEIGRVYADHWGAYNGLVYSTWEVNPPNPTGYSPNMAVFCMNDAGTGASPDPLYQSAYSQFCYELPFMPGQTAYLDTPVVPTSAFAGAGYNNPDCAYPDATPAVSEVDGDGVGPWVGTTAGAHSLKIYALGNATDANYAYSGPAAMTAPFNAKTVTRHYGFGSPGTASSVQLVSLDGSQSVSLSFGANWSDTMITAAMPAVSTLSSSSWNCPVQQQVQYGGPTATAPAKCGELVITTASGKKSIDTVTVTIGGKAPIHVGPTASLQAAIDQAAPGDMLMVDPATRATASAAAAAAVHHEVLLMWKPIRLQGVGAPASVIDANTHPAGKLDFWRRQVNCLFGLALNGQPFPTAGSQSNPYDSDGLGFSCPIATNPKAPLVGPLAAANFGNGPTTLNYFSGRADNPQIDRLPLEAVVGWDASQNGNLAELLQEPSLMGALEGAGITVLAKGMEFPTASDPFGLGAAGAGIFPTGTLLLNGGTSTTTPRGFDTNNTCGPNTASGVNPYPSNFYCNPSSIDGLTVTDSSQGGGAVFVHGWAHNLQIANDRLVNNAGTLSGGVNLGQGEFAPAYTVGGTNADPGSCQNPLFPVGTQLPYCFDVNVNLHHNDISRNSSTGDELFSATPSGAGGVTIADGADNYKFTNNWVCGNLSTGDGGGVAHIGFSYNGDIEHNTIIFNQSTNPTIPTNGGGLLIMGSPDADPTCGAVTDQDCVPTPAIAPADGTGPGLTINANLILGNAAESGSGGGLRFQNVNGTDVLTFPTVPARWYSINTTNNIIANNVAGWDGAGISLYDALDVNIVNNTIASNDTTASSGMLFTTLGAPLASSTGSNCTLGSNSCPQPAGIVSVQSSANLMQNLPAGTITCPPNHFQPGTAQSGTGAVPPSCIKVSYPELFNNVIWENRAFDIGVGTLGTGAINQQNVVALFNAFTTTQAVTQPTTDAITPIAGTGGTIVTGGTGACVNPVSYWDIGVRGDTGPTNHASTVTLAPQYSVLTDAGDYVSLGSLASLNNSGGNPGFLQQYCNGSRTPPEFQSLGYLVPPGISDATVPNPIFNLTPVATVDEGNNWINISWGPLSLVNISNGANNGQTLGNYGISGGSAAINLIPSTATTQYTAAPTLDFYGTVRKNGAVDAGAVELTGGAAVFVTPSSLSFGDVVVGTTSAARTLTVRNSGATAVAGGVTVGLAAPFARATGAAAGNCSAATTLAANGGACTIGITFTPTAAQAYAGQATITASVTVGGSPVPLTGTGVAAVRSFSVAPNPLAFGNWAAGTTSNPLFLTVTNTGNVALAGGSFAFGGGTPQPFSRVNTGTFPAGAGNCGAGLGIGASCTVKVQFAAPATNGAYSRTLTVGYTGVTSQPVTLTGTSVAARATATQLPNPLLITLPTGAFTGVGTVTFTNTAPAGGSSVAITNVTASGGTILTWFFNVVGGQNTCTGANLLPGASCSVDVRFTNVTAPRGVNRAGTLTFTDTATGSPQVVTLTGHANP